MSEPIKNAWHKLDNAAKIFPPISGRSNTRVFRVSCELNETVDGEILQSAADSAIDDFPGFRYVLKRGMFWYYLEQSSIRPLVHEEDAPPCSTIYLDRKTLLFDVTWYDRRINLEVYHVLTDGTGAFQFLKSLVLHYLKLAHPGIANTISNIDYDASDAHKMTDSFDKYYDRNKTRGKLKTTVAYHLKGSKEAEWRLNVIEGSVSVNEVLQKAREYNATVTVLVTALLMHAIYEEMSVRDRKNPVVITVPVDLRNYFKSKSTRNFFSLVDIKYDFCKHNDTLENIIRHVKECFDEHLNKEYFQTRLNELLRLERNLFVRPIPLVIKNLCMNIAYFFSAREVTAAVSNLGKIDMPDEVKPYVKLFDVFTSTEKLQISICSYDDNMNISFTSPFVNTDIQHNFFRQLAQMGIVATISANNLKKKQENQNEYDVFPFVPLVSHKHSLMFRMLQLCSAVTVIISLTVNWMFPQSGFWSLFVAAGIACVWLSLIISLRKRNNILKNLTYQVTAASIFAVLWDAFTGWHGWSIDFVIPIAFVVAMSATAILARIRKMQTETYIIYSLLLILYGIIPAAFVLSGLCTIVYPAVICVAFSLVSLAALLIFEGKHMIEELKRRMHL